MRAFESLLVRISEALEREGIPYMVIGGQAVLIHGEPRFTRDIDITLGIDTNEAQRVLKIARALHLKPAKEATEEFIRQNAVLPVEDHSTRILVDFIFSFLPYERQAIQRAQPVAVGKAPVRFATAEDTIIHKLFAGRPRDIEDVKGIVNNTKELDASYLNKWLKNFSPITGRDLIREYEKIKAEVFG